MPLRYWILIFILGIGWGSSFVFNEVLLREIGPLNMSLGRVGFGAIGCWIWAITTRKQIKHSMLILVGMVFLGILNYAIPFAIFPFSQQYVSSGVAGIINAMTPVMVVLVSHFWPGGEKITVLKALGAIAGVIGITVLASPTLKEGGGSQLWAILVGLMAPACYGVALNYSRRFKSIDATVLTAWALTGATIFIAPIALTVEGVPQITRMETWIALLVLGFVLTSAAFIALFWLLPRVGATNTSTVTFIAPVSAVLLGLWLLNEQVLPEHLMGMAAIFLGLLLIDGRIFKRKKAKKRS